MARPPRGCGSWSPGGGPDPGEQESPCPLASPAQRRAGQQGCGRRQLTPAGHLLSLLLAPLCHPCPGKLAVTECHLLRALCWARGQWASLVRPRQPGDRKGDVSTDVTLGGREKTEGLASWPGGREEVPGWAGLPEAQRVEELGCGEGAPEQVHSEDETLSVPEPGPDHLTLTSCPASHRLPGLPGPHPCLLRSLWCRPGRCPRGPQH